ncbi:MAG: hypothetical protein ACHQRJ_14610 [Alphaproteobacteria bacterium]
MPNSDDEDPDENGADRSTARLAGLALILLLAVLGLFLAQKLRSESALEDCLMSGRSNCAPIGEQHP